MDPRHPYPMSSQSQSPATHPSSLARSADVSPPTSVGPSPEEEVTDPSIPRTIASTKDVSNEGQTSSLERKPSQRQRLLSFGSIQADGEVVADAASELGEGARTAEDKSGTLGLNIESLHVGEGADVTPKDTERLARLVSETTIPAFSVGLAPGDSGPSKKKAQVTAAASGAPHIRMISAPAVMSSTQGDVDRNEKNPLSGSSSELTWEFGTVKQAAAEGDLLGPPAQKTVSDAVGSSSNVASEAIPLRVRLSPLGAGLNPEGLPPTPIPASAGGVLYDNHNALPGTNTESKEDEWKVRDFGYGFGRPRPEGAAYLAPREDRTAKDRPFYNGGGRLGSRPYDAMLEGFRRGFGGRRGRGSSRGYGRGRQSLGRGDYVPGSRPYGRYPPRDIEYDVDASVAYGVPPVDPSVYYAAPYTIPPPGFMPPYDIYGAYPAGYALPPVPVVTPTVPVPNPVTKLSFPLDPTRYYLLGQLEYYLSEDNLAQDFYLRQQVS
jgi:la-related protein 1